MRTRFGKLLIFTLLTLQLVTWMVAAKRREIEALRKKLGLESMLEPKQDGDESNAPEM